MTRRRVDDFDTLADKAIHEEADRKAAEKRVKQKKICDGLNLIADIAELEKELRQEKTRIANDVQRGDFYTANQMIGALTVALKTIKGK